MKKSPGLFFTIIKSNGLHRLCLGLIAFFFGTFFSVNAQIIREDFSSLERLTLEELMNLTVITASGKEQTISEAPSTMLVITSKEIEERGYEQLDDVLRDIPGVDMIHVHAQAPSFISFRGMHGDENKRLLFLIDGIEENSLMGGYEMGGPSYNLHNAERVEIIWGPASALYGANAFSAVINIITKKADYFNYSENKNGGIKYQRGYGSFNSRLETIFMAKKIDNLKGGSDLSAVLSGSLFNSDGARFGKWDPDYSNSFIDNAWSVNGNLNYNTQRTSTTFGARAYQTPGGAGQLVGSPTQLLRLPVPDNENKGLGGMVMSDFNGDRPSLVETYSRTFFLQSNFKINESFEFIIGGQYRETGRKENSYQNLVIPGTGFVSRDIFTHYANRVKGEFSINYHVNEKQLITGGFQYWQDNLERGYRGVNRDTAFVSFQNIRITNVKASFKPREYTLQDNIGTYLQYMVQSGFLNKTDITLGARFDNNSVYGSSFNPRIALINQPNKKITLKLLSGKAFRAPTNFELYTAAGGRIANPNLKPETIMTYEANIIYSPFEILMVQTNLFRNELDDIIIQNVPIGGGLFQNRNIGSSSVSGLEGRILFIPTEKFNSFLNLTFQEGTQNDGTQISGIPNIAAFKGNFGFTLKTAEKFSITAIENYVGDRSVPSSNPLGNVPAYYITNLVFHSKKLFDEHVSASITINNLFNQVYYDPGIRSAEGVFYPTVSYQPGRNIHFKLILVL